MTDQDLAQPDALDRLVDEFPKIFASGRPPASFLPPGWRDLVRRLLLNISAALSAGEEFEVRQIKEKYGVLRFYWSLSGRSALNLDVRSSRGSRRMTMKPEPTGQAYELIDKLVDAAEDASLETCEHCGQPGSLIQTGWWRVRCDDCRREN